MARKAGQDLLVVRCEPNVVVVAHTVVVTKNADVTSEHLDADDSTKKPSFGRVMARSYLSFCSIYLSVTAR